MLSKDDFDLKVNFRDILSEQCYDYIQKKQLSGLHFVKQAHILRRFLNMCSSMEFSTSHISKEAIDEWEKLGPNESISNQYVRISVVKGFAKYVASRGIEAYIPRSVPRKFSCFTPYILSTEELGRIFNATDQLEVAPMSPSRHLVLKVLFRVLYGCGLRISEALNLNVEDVNLTDGILTIRKSKLDKERLVPMDSSLIRRCVEYADIVNASAKPKEAFFPSPAGGHYDSGTMYYAWRQVLTLAGISHGGKGKGPRIHDLRHTFAVHCFQKWIFEGIDLNAALPYLSAYMGHVGLSSTQQYLRLLPEMYPNVVQAMERKFDVVPGTGART